MNREIIFEFVFQHPESKETKTKRYTLEKIMDLAEEDLLEIRCDCEPIGETNVVECNCEDYLYEFQLIAKRQYAGLKDKNGNGYYEGDEVLVPEGFYGDNAMSTVKEHKDTIEYDSNDGDCDGSGFWLNLPDGIKWSDCEIIGNIYENQEPKETP